MKFSAILVILPFLAVASAAPQDTTTGVDTKCVSNYCMAMSNAALKCAKDNGLVAADGTPKTIDPTNIPGNYKTCLCTSPSVQSNLKRQVQPAFLVSSYILTLILSHSCLTCFTDPKVIAEYNAGFEQVCKNTSGSPDTGSSTESSYPTTTDAATKSTDTSSPTTSGDATESIVPTGTSKGNGTITPTGTGNGTLTTNSPVATGNAASAIEITAWKLAGALAVAGGLVAVM